MGDSTTATIKHDSLHVFFGSGKLSCMFPKSMERYRGGKLYYKYTILRFFPQHWLLVVKRSSLLKLVDILD